MMRAVSLQSRRHQVFICRVTAVCANSLPLIDALVFMAIIVLVRIVPSKCAVVPMVTAPADCQNTFLACAPPARVTFLAEASLKSSGNLEDPYVVRATREGDVL